MQGGKGEGGEGESRHPSTPDKKLVSCNALH